MFRLRDHEVDRIVDHRGHYLLGGLALGILSFALPKSERFGLVALGFAVFALGIYGIALRRWRDDPGLWMLAALLVVTLTPCYAWLEYERLIGAFFPAPGRQPAPIGWQRILASVEFLVVFSVFWRQVRFAYSVAASNWKTSRLMKQLKKRVEGGHH